MPLSRIQTPVLKLVGGDASDPPLGVIYRRYCPYVAAVILRLQGRTNDVDDLVQDVFVEAARGIAGLREPDAIKGWLATIAVRLVRRRLRRRRLGGFFGLDVEADYSQLVDPKASPADRLFAIEVYAVLDQLPVDDRLALALHLIEGEKLEAVARLCGCSLATTKRRIARAQAALKARLGDG